VGSSAAEPMATGRAAGDTRQDGPRPTCGHADCVTSRQYRDQRHEGGGGCRAQLLPWPPGQLRSMAW